MSAPFIHPSALVDEGAVLGDDVFVWHFAHVMGGARVGARTMVGQGVFIAPSVTLGQGCRVQNNVSLYDGVILGDFVFIGPSAVFTNVRRPRAAFPKKEAFEPTIVEDHVSVGANSTIRCGVRLGFAAFVAAGAVVTRSVPSHTLVAGAPARPIGWVCLCGESIDDGQCAACQRRYRPSQDGGLEIDE